MTAEHGGNTTTLEVVHEELPEGEWWACEFPERPPEPFRIHYRRGCHLCWPAFMANAKTTNRFVVGGVTKAVYDFDATREWWFDPWRPTLAGMVSHDPPGGVGPYRPPAARSVT